MGVVGGSNNGHGMADPNTQRTSQPFTSSLVSEAAERAVHENPNTEIWDPFSGRPRPMSRPASQQSVVTTEARQANAGANAPLSRSNTAASAASASANSNTAPSTITSASASMPPAPQISAAHAPPSKVGATAVSGPPMDEKAKAKAEQDIRPTADTPNTASRLFALPNTITTHGGGAGGSMTVDQLAASLTTSDMPQAMPSGPAAPPRPQRPGAYNATATGGRQRNNSLYKGGLHILGRESNTIPRNDSTDYDEFPDLDSPDNPSQQNNMLPYDPFSGEPRGEHELGDYDEEQPPRPRVIHIIPSQRDVHLGDYEYDKEGAKAKSGGGSVGKGDLTSKVMKASNLYKIIGVVVIAVLIGIVVIVVGVLFGTDKSEDAQESAGPSDGSSNGDGKPPILEQLEMVFGSNPAVELPAETFVAIQFSPQGSPQRKAFQWLIEDPKLNKYSVQQKRQRMALAIIYYATNGPNWFDQDDAAGISNHWLDYNLHECEWFSLARGQQQEPCYNYTVLNNLREQHVDYKTLLLSGNLEYTNKKGPQPALQGTIPPQIGMLTKMASLDLGHQNLKGSIPTELVTLGGTLRNVVLEQGFFTGTIPDGLYGFARVLRLNGNDRLSEGTIPTDIGRNPDLSHLGLMGTNRRGSIPDQMYRVTTLKQLLFSGNKLTGSVSTQIGAWAGLREFDVNVNKFKGRIPSQLGLLTELNILRLGGNRFSGILPTEFGLLSSMQNFGVANNGMNGTIPSEIGSWTSLVSLDLSQNGLSGILPTSLSQLSELTLLDVSTNDITGSLRRDLLTVYNETASRAQASWPHLEALKLSNNGMEGSIPSEIGLLRSLKKLYLRANNFESSLPDELRSLDSLQELLVEATKISWSIPEEICELPLEMLRVECNRVECPATCKCICA